MDPKVYAKFVTDGSFYAGHGEHNEKELVYLTLGLSGESGEFADLVKKIVRTSYKTSEYYENYEENKDRLQDELGDVLWYLQGLCTFLGIGIGDLMESNTRKLCERHNIKCPI